MNNDYILRRAKEYDEILKALKGLSYLTRVDRFKELKLLQPQWNDNEGCGKKIITKWFCGKNDVICQDCKNKNAEFHMISRRWLG